VDVPVFHRALQVSVRELQVNAALDLIRRKVVLPILDKPFDHKWQVQGLGMLRTYLDPNTRMHIWHSKLNYCADSGWHTHPWDFSSFIVAGSIQNKKYLKRVDGEFLGESEPPFKANGAWTPFMEQQIICGPGGCAMSEPKLVYLFEAVNVQLYAGSTYAQRADEIHTTLPADGTISIITRKTVHEDGSANIYYPVGSTWSSAEARPAEDFEIILGVNTALKRLSAEGAL
jgi:hypothetical protein